MINWMLNSSRPDPNWYINALYYSAHLYKSITFRMFVLLTCRKGLCRMLLSCSVQSVTRDSAQRNAATLCWEEMKHLSLWRRYQLISTESSFRTKRQACRVFKYHSLPPLSFLLTAIYFSNVSAWQMNQELVLVSSERLSIIPQQCGPNWRNIA